MGSERVFFAVFCFSFVKSSCGAVEIVRCKKNVTPQFLFFVNRNGMQLVAAVRAAGRVDRACFAVGVAVAVPLLAWRVCVCVRKEKKWTISGH